MVRLTVDLITKYGPGHNKRRPDETVPHYLGRITHLYLQEKSIEKLVRKSKTAKIFKKFYFDRIHYLCVKILQYFIFMTIT